MISADVSNIYENKPPLIKKGINWYQFENTFFCIFEIEVYDEEENEMNATWDFGDGTPVTTYKVETSINSKNESYSFLIVDHEYNLKGNYEVKVNISDGMGGYTLGKISIFIEDSKETSSNQHCLSTLIILTSFTFIIFFITFIFDYFH